MNQVLRLSVLFVFLNIPFFLTAQPVQTFVQDVTMPAPNAAALGKYGDIPVSYYTGVPNIDIPIYTVQQGPLSLPVSLSYHASGIKLGELASWVGIGWSLNAGGMITRTIQGLADDSANGYYYHGDSISGSGPDHNELLQVAYGSLDSEPDIFSFNVNGHSGKFYFDRDQVIRLIPVQDIEIEVILNNAVFTTFIITTPDGNRHIFGKDPDSTQSAIEASLSSNQPSPNNTSWYLIRIESYDGEHAIDLTYDSDRYSYRTLSTCKWVGKSCTSPGSENYTFGPECPSDAYQVNSEGSFPNNRYTTTNINGYRLAQISSTTQTVDFEANTTRLDLDDPTQQTPDKKRLDAIEINSGSYCKKFSFSYDYFEDPFHTTVTEGKRLKLESLQESDCNETNSIPAYEFEYEGNNTLPFRLSKETDHWGFYNGATINDDSLVGVPYTEVQLLTSGTVVAYGNADKESHESFMKRGSLKKIIYPTGGFTEFTLEANEVMDSVVTGFTTAFNDSLKTSPGPTNGSLNCTTVVKTDTLTFQSQDEIDEGIMTLSLVTSLTCETSVNKHFKIEALVNGVTPAGLIQFGIDDDPQADTIITLPVNDLASTNFQVGVQYTFRLTTTDAWGKFEIKFPTVSYQPKDVGGLRVKKIRSHDGISTDNDIIREYEYLLPGSLDHSSGQLLAEPRYAEQLFGTNLLATCQGGCGLVGQTVNIVSFYEQSVIPLSSFQGYHIAYTNVKEIHKDGTGNAGYSLYKFDVTVDANALLPQYPIIPAQIQLRNGKLLEDAKYDKDDNLVLKTTHDDLGGTFNYNGPANIWKVAELGSCEPPSGYTVSKFMFTRSYNIFSGTYLVTKDTVIRDGVMTITDYDYDNTPVQNHLMPVEVEVTNSDGKVTRMEYTFPNDSVGTAVYDSLVNRNIVVPIAEFTYVDNELVDGNWTQYGLFSGNPYPEDFYRYEATWTGGNLIGSWESQGSIGGYSNGYPTSFTKTGWDTESYTWTTAGLIDQRSFQNFTWNYDYHTGTRMVSKITDIDGQFVEYDYDDFMRLNEVRARLDSVITTYDYVYRVDFSGNIVNYVKKETAFHPVPGSALTNRTTFDYMDGLGRSIQTVENSYSPNQKDVVRSVNYDNQGRLAVIYEPFESVSDTGAFIVSPPGSPGSTINSYEASPLNRLIGVKPPDWYTTITQYSKNSSGFTIPGTSVSYGSGELFIQTVIEPDGNEGTTSTGDKTITFTDKKGRVIRSRREEGSSGSGATDTYYLYDDKDRPVIIIPPGADADDDDLIYRYTYSGEDLILSKKLPGQDSTVSYLYNNRDLPTYMQDANMKVLGRWLHTHYDSYGRVIASGFYNDTISNGNLVKNFNTRLSSNLYGSIGILKGKLVGTRRTILGTNDTLIVNHDYDAYGRVDETTGNNHLHEGTDAEMILYTYDFADNTISDKRTHKAFGETQQIDQRWTYDHSGRNITHFLELNQTGEMQLSAQQYTVKDQLKKKQLGYTGSGFLQSLDYTYLENGFLKRINEFDLAGTGGDPDDLFYLELGYDNPTFSSATDAYNGNISDAHWRVKGELAKAYRYEYDHLNRLTSADYGAYSTASQGSLIYTGDYDTQYNYDARGNITYLYRKGIKSDGQGGFSPGLIDEMLYSYPTGSNQLTSINDIAPGGFKELGFHTNGHSGSYDYDANGNLDIDPYKQLSIAYNYLNLPEEVNKTGGGKIKWLYDADGNKLQRKVTNNVLSLTGVINSGTYQADQVEASGMVMDTSSVTMIGDSSVTLLPGFTVEAGSTFSAEINDTGENIHDYVGNIEYQNGALEAIYFEEGRVFYYNDTSRFEYVIRDHLESTRVIFSDLNDNGQVNETEILQEEHYYSFGLTQDGPWKYHPNDNVDYKFNQLERNEALGLNWDLAVLRSYDATVGRWTQVDPKAEKYYNMTPYTGMGNNPILFTDMLGDSVNVAHIRATSPDDYKTMEAELEEITGLTLTADDSGNLTYKTPKGKLKGSKRARKMLMKAIDHEETVTVKDNRGGGSAVTTMDPSRPIEEQNEINIAFDQLDRFVKGTSSDLDSKTYGYGMNLLHELGHTRVGGRKEDWAEGDVHKLGSNVKNVNKIRKELGPSYGQRVDYNVFNVTNDRAHVYYPFSKSALRSLKKGEKPTSGFVRTMRSRKN